MAQNPQQPQQPPLQQQQPQPTYDRNQLYNLSLDRLRTICTDWNIDVTNFRQNRKREFVDAILNHANNQQNPVINQSDDNQNGQRMVTLLQDALQGLI